MGHENIVVDLKLKLQRALHEKGVLLITAWSRILTAQESQNISIFYTFIDICSMKQCTYAPIIDNILEINFEQNCTYGHYIVI